MTVNQLFKTVLSLMFCPLKDGDEYKEAFLNILNMKLAECFMINNALREFKEKDALKSAQRVEDFSSMLEYEDEINRSLSLADKIESYVKEHYKEDISRDRDRLISSSYSRVRDIA